MRNRLILPAALAALSAATVLSQQSGQPAGTGGTAGAEQPAFVSPFRQDAVRMLAALPRASVVQSLSARAGAQGTVRIIVGVRASFQPEGSLVTADAVRAQRAGIDLAQDALLAQVSGYTPETLKRFETIPFVAMSVDANTLQQLAASPLVTSIEEDLEMSPALSESMPLIGAPTAWAAGFTGSGWSVAIVDSGVERTHPFFGNRVVAEACFSTTDPANGLTSFCPGGASEAFGPGAAAPCTIETCDHGTHVAGIAAGRGSSFSGVARDAGIIAIQVNSRSSGGPTSTASDVVRALEYVLNLSGSRNIAAVNMSLAGGRFMGYCDARLPASAAIMNNVLSAGIAPVVASGNSSWTDSIGQPACLMSALSVGSTDDGSGGTFADVVSDFSNTHPILLMLAPGNRIISSVTGAMFGSKNGTSMATPTVAGAWTVLRAARPTATVAQIFQSLQATGIPIQDYRVPSITRPRIRLNFALGYLGAGDADADQMPDWWEDDHGLNYQSGIGQNGATGDPDGDGRTNLQEYQAGTHPVGLVTRYLAEGASSSFFDTRFALLNTSSTAPARTLMRFLKADGTTVRQFVVVPPLTRRTVDAKNVLGLYTATMSLVVESDQPVVVDRTMTWNSTGYGSHAETSVAAPSTALFFAEGATHSGFNLFYLLQNPSLTQPATVTVRYLLSAAAPVDKTYTVPANSRFNVWVNSEGDSIPALKNADVSASITSNIPIIAERAMYLDKPGQTFGAGHNSAAIAAAATSWFLAEGATGNFFDLFVLIANANAQAANITARFLLSSGQVITKNYVVGANSRFNIWVDLEDAALADAAVSTTIQSNVPVVVERAMWWPGPTAATWHEAHNSPGSTQTGLTWALAEGEVGGSRSVETYILIANASAAAGSARVTLAFEDGTRAQKTFFLNPNSRFTVSVAAEFSAAADKRFAAIIESVGGSQIVVERAMYSNAGSVIWAAGTNALGTRLQ